MRPARGVTLVIDGEIVTDDATIVMNGTEAVAWAYNPDEDEDGIVIGMETVGKLVKASEQRNPARITGTDATIPNGEQQTWEIKPGRGCQDC